MCRPPTTAPSALRPPRRSGVCLKIGNMSAGPVPADPPVWDDEIKGWVVKRTEHWIVSVHPMLFNDRIILTNVEEYPWFNTSGWCYDKGGSAAIAAHIFDPETEHEPVGHKKIAYDGRSKSGSADDTH